MSTLWCQLPFLPMGQQQELLRPVRGKPVSLAPSPSLWAHRSAAWTGAGGCWPGQGLLTKAESVWAAAGHPRGAPKHSTALPMWQEQVLTLQDGSGCMCGGVLLCLPHRTDPAFRVGYIPVCLALGSTLCAIPRLEGLCLRSHVLCLPPGHHRELCSPPAHAGQSSPQAAQPQPCATSKCPCCPWCARRCPHETKQPLCCVQMAES